MRETENRYAHRVPAEELDMVAGGRGAEGGEKESLAARR